MSFFNYVQEYIDMLISVCFLENVGLPPWILPLHLPNSRENFEGLMNKHRKFHNDYYKSALKHLRVSLYSTVPVIEAFHPLIQVLQL